MKKYIIYARVASRKQTERSFSINSQLEILKELAQKNNIEADEVYIDLGSAKKNRKKFNQMIDKLSKGEADGILCTSLDRLSRSDADYQRIEFLINLKGIQIITPTQIYNNDAGKMLLMRLEIAFNTFNRMLINQKIRAGIKNRKEVTK